LDVGKSPFRREPGNWIDKPFEKLFKTETEIPQMAPLRYPQDRGYCETLMAHDRGVTGGLAARKT
jgi:hypothetical protein